MPIQQQTIDTNDWENRQEQLFHALWSLSLEMPPNEFIDLIQDGEINGGQFVQQNFSSGDIHRCFTSDSFYHDLLRQLKPEHCAAIFKHRFDHYTLEELAQQLLGLTNSQVRSIFSVTNTDLTNRIRTGYDLKLALEPLSPPQRAQMYDSLKSTRRIPVLKTTADLHSALEHLNPEQRANLYKEFKDQPGNLLSSEIDRAYYLNQALCHLEPVYRDEIYEKFKHNGRFDSIFSASDLSHALEFLNPQQRSEIYEHMQQHQRIPQLIKSTLDFDLACRYLSAAQCAEVYQELQTNQSFPEINSIGTLIDLAPYIPVDAFRMHCEQLRHSETYLESHQYNVHLLFHLEPQYSTVAYEVFDGGVTINSAELFGFIIKQVEPTTKKALFERYKDRGTDLIDSSSQLYQFLQHLDTTQRNEIYQQIKEKDFLRELDCVTELNQTLAFLEPEQRKEVYNRLNNKNFLEQMSSASEFNAALEFLESEQRIELYDQALQTNPPLSSLISTFEELGLMLEFLEPQQATELYQQLSDTELVHFIHTMPLEELTIQLTSLNPRQFARTYALLQERFTDHDYQIGELGGILSYLNPQQAEPVHHSLFPLNTHSKKDFPQALSELALTKLALTNIQDFIETFALLSEEQCEFFVKNPCVPPQFIRNNQNAWVPSEFNLFSRLNVQQCAALFVMMKRWAPQLAPVYREHLLKKATPAQYDSVVKSYPEMCINSANDLALALACPHRTPVLRAQITTNIARFVDQFSDLDILLTECQLTSNQRIELCEQFKSLIDTADQLSLVLKNVPTSKWFEFCMPLKNKPLFFNRRNLYSLMRDTNFEQHAILFKVFNEQIYTLAYELMDGLQCASSDDLKHLYPWFREHLSLRQVTVLDAKYIASATFWGANLTEPNFIRRSLKSPTENIPLYLRNTPRFFSPYQNISECGEQLIRPLTMILMHSYAQIIAMTYLVYEIPVSVLPLMGAGLCWTMGFFLNNMDETTHELFQVSMDFLSHAAAVAVFACVLNAQLLLQLPLVIASIFTRSVTTVFTVCANCWSSEEQQDIVNLSQGN